MKRILWAIGWIIGTVLLLGILASLQQSLLMAMTCTFVFPALFINLGWQAARSSVRIRIEDGASASAPVRKPSTIKARESLVP